MIFDSFLGQVLPYPGNAAPVNWMFCRGQELEIKQFPTLYHLLGNTYGGNGVTTFALPNLCARVAIHQGQAPRMQRYTAGETGGHEKVLLTKANTPPHKHTVNVTGKPNCSSTPGSVDAPGGHYPAPVNGSSAAYSTVATNGINMAGATLQVESPPAFGQNVQEPMPVISPYLTMNYIICISGIMYNSEEEEKK